MVYLCACTVCMWDMIYSLRRGCGNPPLSYQPLCTLIFTDQIFHSHLRFPSFSSLIPESLSYLFIPFLLSCFHSPFTFLISNPAPGLVRLSLSFCLSLSVFHQLQLCLQIAGRSLAGSARQGRDPGMNSAGEVKQKAASGGESETVARLFVWDM